MINRANNAVSINLRNLDGINLEQESDEEDGKAEQKATSMWDAFYIVLCSFAVLIDPLLCYLISTEVDHMCIRLNFNLGWAYVATRTTINVFYDIDIIVFLCEIYKKRYGEKVGACSKGKKVGESWKPRTNHPKLTALYLYLHDRLQVIEKLYSHEVLPILPRILAALPIPEAVLISTWLFCWDPYPLFISASFQYILRIILIYTRRPRSKNSTREIWLKHLLYSLPFILAPHQYGGWWYYLAIQRQMDCWRPYCEDVLGYKCKNLYDFLCDYEQRMVINGTVLQEWCPTINEDKKVFDFGIYFYALQSKTTDSFNLPRKIFQSVWLALRNLSSFGSNLSTSMTSFEIIFSVAISISGMSLFLVFLNARIQIYMQESLEVSNQLKAKEKKKNFSIPVLDLWLSNNDLMTRTNDCEGLKTNNKKKNALKTKIIENVHKLEENEDINIHNIISILPKEYKKSITRFLCWASLKKVPLLANLNDKMLKVICEHLKPVIYTEDNYIVKEGIPLRMLLFITQGIAWTYTTSKIDGAKTSNTWLKRGDSNGEELLNWAVQCPSFSDLPISTMTVLSHKKS